MVERPASVVKEAVENSVDAGATEVRVSVFEGGKVRLTVEDNGEGMAFGDLPLAVSRHATSKISSVEELGRLNTLGFRGEALPSIAAVSRLEIRSRREGDDEGGLLRVEGGSRVLHTPISCRKGTWLSVEDLFYTLPARKKFMKSALSEGRRISALIRDFAAAYPSVAFYENRDGKDGFSTPGDGDREGVLRILWGRDADLRGCEAAATNLKLECWWAPFPGKTRSQVSSFVNGRVVNDSVIRGAAGSICRSYPGNWMFLFTLDPELLDANIHPAKAEVRFRYPGEVFDTIQQAVLKLSGDLPVLPAGTGGAFSPKPSINLPFSPPPAAARRGGGSGWSFREGPEERRGDELFGRVGSEPPPFAPEAEGENFRFLGQIASGYLVFETEDGLAVMDPHAAHERIGFERTERLAGEAIVTQKCAVPLPVPPSLSLEAHEHKEELEKLGFAFLEEDGLLSLTAYPSLPGGVAEDPVRLIRTILLDWSGEGRASLEEILWKKLATIACGLSVKLGDRISPSEALALWRNLLECRSPWNCPHGRPTALSLTAKRLESYFGRE
ncbi:MAG: DNA mismatch repair endonuclease MutL [Aminivibrio sp.]